jgi:DNA-binding NtrC family response regulator
MLRQRPWRGNVRELENLTRKAVIVGHGPVLQPEHLFPSAFSGAEPETPAPAPNGHGPTEGLDAMIASLLDVLLADDNLPLLPTVERMLIAQALERTGWNQVQAARMLGISRNTLRSRMDKHGLHSSTTRASLPPPSTQPPGKPPDDD